jgi:hypothetical protein
MQVQVYLKDHIHGDMGLAFLLSYAISIEKLNLPSLAAIFSPLLTPL